MGSPLCSIFGDEYCRYCGTLLELCDHCVWYFLKTMNSNKKLWVSLNLWFESQYRRGQLILHDLKKLVLTKYYVPMKWERERCLVRHVWPHAQSPELGSKLRFRKLNIECVDGKYNFYNSVSNHLRKKNLGSSFCKCRLYMYNSGTRLDVKLLHAFICCCKPFLSGMASPGWRYFI